MRMRLLGSIGVLICMAMLGACSKSSPSAEPGQELSSQQANTLEQEVAFDFNFSALLTKEINPGFLDDFTIRAVANLMTGTMQVENLDNNSTDTYDWSVNLDESDLGNVQSLKALQLVPGNYSFYLVLNKDDDQYVGSAVHTVADGAQEFVPMTIRPVIGGGQIDTSVVASLSDFKFNYAQDQLAEAGLTNPSIGITIGGGVEQIFSLDPATGLSEYMMLNLTPGTYDIALRLFDSGAQVGKSLASQGASVSVSSGFDVSMDIVPLFGEIGMALSVEGGDAVFNINVPAEVVDEAGSLDNLRTRLNVVGPENSLRELDLTLAADEIGGYTSSVTLTDMYFGNLNFEIEFFLLSENQTLASCVDSGILSNIPVAVECKVTLKLLSDISGSILSTLGVNVINATGEPVSGAVISVDGIDAAITDSAAFSTPGYSKLFLKPGDREISARFGSAFGATTYTSTALGVGNIDLLLDQPILLQDDFGGDQSGLFAPSDYWFGCASLGGFEGSVGAGVMTLGSRYNDLSSDWCDGTSALTTQSFVGTEINDAGGFIVSVDVLSADAPDSTASIGVGNQIGIDPLNFDQTLTADAVISVSDNTVVISTDLNSSQQGTYTSSTPYLLSEVNNLRIEVIHTSFAANTSASIGIVINNNLSLSIPRRVFTWDGGDNHILLKGKAGTAVNGSGANYITFDNLLIRPR